MPLIHIKSLPFQEAVDVEGCIQNVSKHFSAEMAIEEIYVTVTWAWLPHRQYVAGGKIFESQMATTPPILVDLVIPDFHTKETIQRMLQCIAESLTRFAGVEKENIFIHCRMVTSGTVFDAGKVMEW